MTRAEEFSHGRNYGDYSGIVFYGPPTNGSWLDRLSVSDCYLGPMFHGILDRALRDAGGEPVPSLVSDWNTLEGWAASDGPVRVAPADAGKLADALAGLGTADVSKYCDGCTVEECLRCAAAVREFIRIRLDRGVDLFVEQD